jgi:DNA-binding MarR family transcriptional regulator
MVALIDELVEKELVARQPNPADRRKNVVALTPLGRTTLRRAKEHTAAVEREFLAPLSAADGQRLRRLLQALAEIPVSAAPPAP